jgi:hypothetical protein
MAYLTDAYGNYYPDQAAIDEEERRRLQEEAERQRLAQLAQSGQVFEPGLQPSGAETFPIEPQTVEPQAVEPKAPGDTVAEKQETTTYADGSQTQRITREIPGQAQEPQPPRAEPVVAGPIVPVSDRRGFQPPPPVVTPQMQPVPAGSDYNARVAQMESGGNPNIGFHDPRKSSAYGKYGITDRAWQSIQQSNPALRGIDKTQATPEQMEMAMNTLTQNNGRALQQFGVPVNPNTLAAAHFIGARGLANYLRDGSISEKAAKVNGGYDKTRQIIEARLAGQGGVAPTASRARSIAEGMAPVRPGDVGSYRDPNPAAVITPGTGEFPVANVDITGQAPNQSQPQPIQTRPAVNPETGEIYQEIVPENERIPLNQPFRVTVPLSGGQPPAAAVAPGEQPAGFTGQGLQQPPLRPPVATGSSAEAIQRYQDLQNDPIGLFALREDSTVPEFIRKRAGDRVADLLQQQKRTGEATQAVQNMVASGDTAGMARVMASGGKDEFKVLMRSMFLRMMGANKAADEELSKIGYGNSAEIGINAKGQRASIERDAAGRVIGGTTEDGTALTAAQAIGYSGSSKDKGVAGQTRVRDSKGTEWTQVPTKQGMEFYDNAGRRGVPEGKTVPISVGGDVELQGQLRRQQLDLKLQYAPLEKVGDIIAEDEAKNGPLDPAVKQEIISRARGTGQATTQAARPGQAPAPAQAAPAPAAAPQAGPVAPPAQAPGAVAPVVPGAIPGQAAPAPAQAAPAAAPQAGGAVAPTALPPAGGQYPGQRARESERTAKEQEAFVAKDGTKDQIGVSATDGATVANVRRQQMDIIRNNPSIINILNGQGTQYDRARRIMINAVTGSYSSEEKQRMADDLNQLVGKLDPGQLGALQEFVNMNTVVNAKTLRANSGPGAVSEAEQRANKEANIGNVDRIEAYAALAGLHRSQFTGDLNASKQAFLASRSDIKTTAQWNTEWQKREAELMRQYQSIAKGRFEIMGKAPAATASAQEMAAYRDRVFRAFEVYPAPTFNPSTNRWDYGTPNARRRAMDAALGR